MLRNTVFPALVASLIGLQGCSDPENGQSDAPRPALVTQPLAVGAGQDVFPGEVRARSEPELGFRIGGKISERLVDVGDRVSQGTILARLDTNDVRLQLDAARAQMASAQADHKLAGSELERYRELVERKVISRSQFDAVESRFDASEAQLRQARANLNVARNQADYAALKAPQDGVVAQRLAEAGQVVSPGQPVFVLAVEGDREVRIDLPEQDVGRIAIGMPVAIELWSRPGQVFAGKIRELSPAADPRSRTFEARVTFANDTVGAELGQSARVFVSAGNTEALSIPLSALTAEGEETYVWVVDPATTKLKKTPVEVGPYQEQVVPVLAGLNAGEWVVAAGTHLVREGQKIIPVDRQNRQVNLTAPAATVAADQTDSAAAQVE
ncbi:MAG: efflux RND transporter periplasmic adaptor subunit [Alcanivorax sediminis]|uniref:Efflux RND transporter periplasmic adaptor subunit n=1 Tax=Alcanivorax sediminis TaxID=2663008 RepID=A0A6N7LT56_9GAMM|nr:efflux RND transporter periplasmic adaptor subunit [Alcanivorax sediminis]MQX52526.1 efflux RND transporter periplasmic adaptor subunit [Alcanivorax sediminis]